MLLLIESGRRDLEFLYEACFVEAAEGLEDFRGGGPGGEQCQPRLLLLLSCSCLRALCLHQLPEEEEEQETGQGTKVLRRRSLWLWCALLAELGQSCDCFGFKYFPVLDWSCLVQLSWPRGQEGRGLHFWRAFHRQKKRFESKLRISYRSGG